MRATRLAASLVIVGALVGCTAPPGPGTDVDAELDDSAAPEDVPCHVGTWQLDVADYASQSEAYILGLGLPIESFGMSGVGTISFTQDGLVATEIDLTTTGTIVAGDTRVPLNTRSAYSGSGDWLASTTPDRIDLDNWATLPDPDVPMDPSAPPIPAIDYTEIPSVTIVCSEGSLLLQGPEAPLSALWSR
ncbi:hypothetical protein BH11ACT4_BH11ACT4_17760 [soil metagenome]